MFGGIYFPQSQLMAAVRPLKRAIIRGKFAAGLIRRELWTSLKKLSWD